MEDSSAEKLLATLRRFAFERHRYLNRLARSQHLTRAEFDSLDLLQEAGELRPSELARRLGLTTGAVTSILDRLEKARLVKRFPNPNDRRSVVIRLTKRADAAGKVALSGYVSHVIAEGKRMSPEERELVIRFLHSATEALIAAGEPL